MFKDIGLPELIVILVIIVIFFGLGKLPQVGGQLGKAIRNFQKARTGEDEEVTKKTEATKEANSNKPTT